MEGRQDLSPAAMGDIQLGRGLSAHRSGKQELAHHAWPPLWFL